MMMCAIRRTSVKRAFWRRSFWTPTSRAAERLNLGVDAVIYGHGRISSRVLDWLVRTTNSKFSLLHLPDYDPSGLSEFQRLHARLGRESRYICLAKLKHDSFGSQTLTYRQKPTAKLRSRN